MNQKEIQTPKKPYFFFITLIRALAAVIITNAHYTGIYPSDLIANGGLLGDVMFFSVSGFCLANPKISFGKWYLKRLWRIYAVVWVITLIYVLLGAYEVNTWVDGLKWFAYPTKYHFVASITLLYIPLYFVARYVKLTKKNFAILSLGLLMAQLALYFTVYDTTYYHIDTVREPMIEFLFFLAMLLGLFFRTEYSGHSDHIPKSGWKGQDLMLWLLLLVLMGVYFASKLLFVKKASLSEWQIMNQVVLFITLICLFNRAYSIEDKLKKWSKKKSWRVVEFLSDHTLEIYCVQYVIINKVRLLELFFPLNWLLLTASILLTATALRWVSQRLIKIVNL